MSAVKASPTNTQPAKTPEASHTRAQPTSGLRAPHNDHTKASPQERNNNTTTISMPQSVSPEAQSVSQSAKRKRSSKADQLPSLQDAPGVPEKLGDKPLRLVIVGHNPSDHAW